MAVTVVCYHLVGKDGTRLERPKITMDLVDYGMRRTKRSSQCLLDSADCSPWFGTAAAKRSETVRLWNRIVLHVSGLVMPGRCRC